MNNIKIRVFIVMNKIDLSFNMICQEKYECNQRWVNIRNKINLDNVTQDEKDYLSEEKIFLEQYLKFLAGFEEFVVKKSISLGIFNHGVDKDFIDKIKEISLTDWVAVRSEIMRLKNIDNNAEYNYLDIIEDKVKIFENLDYKLKFISEIEKNIKGLNVTYLSKDEYMERKSKILKKSKEFDNDYSLNLGDHIYVDRYLGIYTHHSIYIGDEKVIHYSGLANGLESGKIEEISLFDFKKGGQYLTKYIYEEKKFYYPRYKIVERAKSRLNEDLYHLFNNNCEHFAHWCVTGEKYSTQVIGSFLLPIRIPVVLVLGGIGSLIEN